VFFVVIGRRPFVDLILMELVAIPDALWADEGISLAVRLLGPRVRRGRARQLLAIECHRSHSRLNGRLTKLECVG
jgi:hypothetical protein